ncbi:hypothetical protein ASL14_12210 [Paenibacillus sp. IHB B 3084]|uniref:hypothetical protein n=1 Tax=Paenibacillus sp. IHB B 3084 TaxID=867076 RepID=UPI000721106B|nr:hypothetical protein [Paenibacillus sp. IHB B 3084]ALP36813.1 hypothetical protein ASL14_12210 [Paenibacillus sp. IHB B 3084]
MNIYDNPEKFAKDLKISLEQAEMWCKNQKKIQEEIEQARLCPKCGKHTLEYEIGSYEEGEKLIYMQ